MVFCGQDKPNFFCALDNKQAEIFWICFHIIGSTIPKRSIEALSPAKATSEMRRGLYGAFFNSDIFLLTSFIRRRRGFSKPPQPAPQLAQRLSKPHRRLCQAWP